MTIAVDIPRFFHPLCARPATAPCTASPVTPPTEYRCTPCDRSAGSRARGCCRRYANRGERAVGQSLAPCSLESLRIRRPPTPLDGSTISTPAGSKSPRLRVTTTGPRASALAAIRLSLTGIDLPRERRSASSLAQRRPVFASIGTQRIRRTTSLNHASRESRRRPCPSRRMPKRISPRTMTYPDPPAPFAETVLGGMQPTAWCEAVGTRRDHSRAAGCQAIVAVHPHRTITAQEPQATMKALKPETGSSRPGLTTTLLATAILAFPSPPSRRKWPSGGWACGCPCTGWRRGGGIGWRRGWGGRSGGCGRGVGGILGKADPRGPVGQKRTTTPIAMRPAGVTASSIPGSVVAGRFLINSFVRFAVATAELMAQILPARAVGPLATNSVRHFRGLLWRSFWRAITATANPPPNTRFGSTPARPSPAYTCPTTGNTHSRKPARRRSRTSDSGVRPSSRSWAQAWSAVGSAPATRRRNVA